MTAVAEPTLVTVLDDQLASRLLYQRIIVLGTEVDDRVANRLCAQLLLLSAEDPRNDISLYINSPGGSVSARHAVQPAACPGPDAPGLCRVRRHRGGCRDLLGAARAHRAFDYQADRPAH